MSSQDEDTAQIDAVDALDDDVDDVDYEDQNPVLDRDFLTRILVPQASPPPSVFEWRDILSFVFVVFFVVLVFPYLLVILSLGELILSKFGKIINKVYVCASCTYLHIDGRDILIFSIR